MIASSEKTRITVVLDDDVIEHFRSEAETKGTGYQTMINAALRAAIAKPARHPKEDEPVTVAVLRKVLREELQTS